MANSMASEWNQFISKTLFAGLLGKLFVGDHDPGLGLLAIAAYFRQRLGCMRGELTGPG